MFVQACSLHTGKVLSFKGKNNRALSGTDNKKKYICRDTHTTNHLFRTNHMEITVFSLIYLITAAVSFLVSMLAWQRKSLIGSSELGMLSLSISFCSFFLTIESSVTTQDAKVFWSQISYLFAVIIPVYFFLFARRYTGVIRFRDMKWGWTLFIFPVITLFIAFTNEYHHLLWSGYSPIDPKTNLMVYYHGYWFWIGYAMYNYVLLFMATYQLARFIIKNKYNKNYRQQSVVIMIAGLFPWVASVFYLAQFTPFNGLDITTISTSFSALLFTWAILKGRLLNLAPVARETLMETLSLGIIALDEKNRIQDINQAARSYLMLEDNGLQGITLQQAVHFNNNKPVSPAVNLLLDAISDSVPDQQLDVSTSQGVVSFRIVKTPIKGIPGTRLVSIQDITEEVMRQEELKQAKMKAEESDKLKSAFLANMSHEIRTPMNSIIGFISLLQEEDLTDVEKTEYLGIVRRNGDRLLSTLNDIVDISKIESGQAVINYSEFDINEVMINTYSLFKQEAEIRGLEFARPGIILPHQSYIRSDKEKVYSIVTNLVKNALKYTTNGFVKLECSISEGELHLSVKDSGIGIPDTKQRAVFERFFQVDSSKRSSYDGAGLGLSITKAFIELLGGSVTLESEEGKGSTFFVRLPVENARLSYNRD